MTTPLAVLPMYDWPEVRAVTDRLWAAIREELETRGIAAPNDLARPTDLRAAWTDAALVLGQTCGLPLVTTLPEVAVVGAFDHRLPDTPPGWYHSVIIVEGDDHATGLADLGGASVAVNSADSQSGHGAWRHELARATLPPGHLGPVHLSGGHRESIVAVAAGVARTAAIDAVSWELACTHEAAATTCRVIHRSEPTPGLPLVTGPGAAVDTVRAAITAAMEDLPAADRSTLHVHGFVPLDRVDYDEIGHRWRAATEAGIPDLAARSIP